MLQKVEKGKKKKKTKRERGIEEMESQIEIRGAYMELKAVALSPLTTEYHILFHLLPLGFLFLCNLPFGISHQVKGANALFHF